MAVVQPAARPPDPEVRMEAVAAAVLRRGGAADGSARRRVTHPLPARSRRRPATSVALPLRR